MAIANLSAIANLVASTLSLANLVASSLSVIADQDVGLAKKVSEAFKTIQSAVSLVSSVS